LDPNKKGGVHTMAEGTKHISQLQKSPRHHNVVNEERKTVKEKSLKAVNTGRNYQKTVWTSGMLVYDARGGGDPTENGKKASGQKTN